jgi:hypothetical protein
MMNINNIPIGGGRRFLVMMDGKPFAGFDTMVEASRYVGMQKSKVKGNSRDKAYAADREWTIKDTGGND